jgi:beta-glucosidase
MPAHQLFNTYIILGKMTTEEEVALTSGANFWETKALERLEVPSIIMTDGPHGLRLQEGGSEDLAVSANLPATCFPPACTLGSTWDPAMLKRVGQALGRETRAAGVSVILGPGVNIKRHPLCGRNFEYFSEDPVLAGHLAAPLIDGIQSEGVGSSLKHFAVNSQETDRMRVSAEVDERTLREIYFPAFEYAVKHAQPWTVMCSYNKINGVYASQNAWLLTQVLREEWGFEGLVVSDWGAVVDRAAAINAGLDLEMPGTHGVSDAQAVAATGRRLSGQALADAALRVLDLVARSQGALNEPGDPEHLAHHQLALEAAVAGTVLLKNDPVGYAPLLPLHTDAKVAVIGELARTPRYQGAGSSGVNPTQLVAALDPTALGDKVSFAPGYTLEDQAPDAARQLIDQAIATARQAQVTVLFLGLPAAYESEGYDRKDIKLPANQLALLDALIEAGIPPVVVLNNGGVVEMPWRDRVPAIIEAWLGGQAGGNAIAQVLYGVKSPGGRLAETIPLRLEDTPAYGNFPGEAGKVRHGEGILVGYRWYDYRDLPVAYPFGHGLTYTNFRYAAAEAKVKGSGDDVQVQVGVIVTNTGDRPAAEVVQVYVGDPAASAMRPVRELKAFAKVPLEPGASERVWLNLTARDFSYWHPGLGRWVLEPGRFDIAIGASSRDIRAVVSVEIDGPPLPQPLDINSTIAEWLAHPTYGPKLLAAMGAPDGDLAAAGLDPAIITMIDDQPARVVASFQMTPLTLPILQDLLAETRAEAAW